MFATVTPFTRLSSKSKFLFAHNVDIMITVCTVFSEISFEFNVNVCSAKQNLLFSHSCRGPPVVVTNDGESEVGECVCVCDNQMILVSFHVLSVLSCLCV